ncbi:MAG: hypothetical protein ACI4DO_08920 [Roseburia sp.]
MADLEKETEYAILNQGEHIEEVVIENRQTEKKQSLDIVWCTIRTSDGKVSYEKQVNLTYILTEQNGWILSDAVVNPEEKWIITPLKGVDETDITDALSGQTIVIEDENWDIQKENIENVKVVDQSTDLEGKKDSITVDVELVSGALIAQGELQMNYSFDANWKLENYEVQTPFECSYQSGAEPAITEIDLMKVISENPIDFTESAKQEELVHASETELSDFSITQSTRSNMGTLMTYDCKFLINKEIVTLEAEAAITYLYDRSAGWEVTEVKYPSVAVSSVNYAGLIGTWKGQMSEYDSSNYTMQSIVMEITEITDDGYVTASIDVPSENRSCVLKGYIDTNDLSFTLSFEEWIQKPKSLASILKPKLQGVIDVEGCSLTCIDTSETNLFDVEKVQENDE